MKILLLFFVLSYSIAFSQNQNEVYNSHFEKKNSNTLIDQSTSLFPYSIGVDNTSPSNSNSELVSYFDNIYKWTVPDKKILCSNVPSPDIYTNFYAPHNQTSRSGNVYTFGVNGEFIVQKLRSTIKSGKIYYIEFFAGASQNYSFGDEVGLKFYKDKPKSCTSGNGMEGRSDPSDVKINYLSSGFWRKAQAFFVADEDYDWIGFGAYGGGGLTTYFDDFRIYELGDDYCSDHDWLFQNTDLYTNSFNSSNKIIAGSNIGSIDDFFTGEVLIKSNNVVHFRAGQSISLEPGFSTESGADFETFIDAVNCENTSDPCPHEVPKDDEYIVCGTTPINIGVNNLDQYVSYSWSPTQYLSNPNIGNPQFIPPPNGSGEITYTLTTTTNCGAFITSPLSLTQTVNSEHIVEYHSNPDPNPSISIINQTISQYEVSISANINPETEFIDVELYNTTGGLIYSQRYKTKDIGCCTFNWNTSEIDKPLWSAINLCNNYEVKVKVSNYCFPNITSNVSIPWNRSTGNTSPNILTQPNVFTIDGNGIECLEVQVANADSYSVQVAGGNSQVFYNNSGPVNSSSLCVWSGQCNTTFCNSNCVLGGYPYYIVLNLYNCHGNSDDNAWFAYLFYGNGYSCNDQSKMTIWDGNEVKNEEDRKLVSLMLESEENGNTSITDKPGFIKEVQVYPNPAKDFIHLLIPNEQINESFSVFNSNGGLVINGVLNSSNNKIDLSNLSKGEYTICIDKINYSTKVIKVD